MIQLTHERIQPVGDELAFGWVGGGGVVEILVTTRGG